MADREHEADVDYEAEEAARQEEYESEHGTGELDDEIVGLEHVTSRSFRNGPVFFVRSASTRGKFYMVVDGACTCKGYLYRQTCNHVTHLEQAGYLVPDAVNGYGYIVANGQSRYHDATRVTTGNQSTLESRDPVVASREYQIRRLQRFAAAQRDVIRNQRGMIAGLRTGSERTVRRMAATLTQAQTVLTNSESELRRGDLVEIVDET